jgi:Domain of unknown function (DUF1905)
VNPLARSNLSLLLVSLRRSVSLVRYQFRSELWMHIGENPWYFVTLPPDQSDEIAEITAPMRKGFGSVRVEVKLDRLTWLTSIFPEAKSGCYVLPIKKQVRLGASLAVGTSVQVAVRLVDL